MTRRTLTTQPLERTDTGHYSELLYDDGGNDDVLICAAHGGEVEPGTAEAAVELAGRLEDATCWACLGYDDERRAFDLYHPPSSSFAPDDYPLLGRIADRGFETVVSLHGLGDDRVIVGGGIDGDVKRRVQSRLDDAITHPVETASDGPYGGVSPDNFVNWLARDGRGGLQLEQSHAIRTDERDAVVGELASLLEDGLR
ncbi:poly-gamma-glutamate hydrolase family protein [Halopiger xanaduensis]|uniref:Phage-related replication protein n=1 Tax=Halopiger xanaduensis (strain DSM 18323 / JCM 14033 / SH-6) TaxID=797210 RepID=F8DB71_HALXS|nr:poly-gamma-glutamate hydrolase family protein [Halopiger xanaduensis]AEH38617.1 protein of unknown function DUF867 [Halopiger xanaduensis SH-6]